jgi:hypothetical protein
LQRARGDEAGRDRSQPRLFHPCPEEGLGEVAAGDDQGLGSSGDLNVAGGDGGNSGVNNGARMQFGFGGSSHLGGGARSALSGTGRPGLCRGTGGSGANQVASGAALLGGDGANGIVIVWEYLK